MALTYSCHRNDRSINAKITVISFSVNMDGSKLKRNNVLKFLYLVFRFLKIRKL